MGLPAEVDDRHRDRVVVPRRNGSVTIVRVVGLVIAVGFAAPIMFLLQQSVVLGSPMLEAFRDPLNLGPLGRSVLLAVSVSATTALLGTAAAWIVTRTNLPLARLWAVVLALPLVLPSYIGAFTLQAALSPGGLTDQVVGLSLPVVEGFWAAWAIMSLLTYPYVYLLVAARLRHLPANLEESAQLLGRTPRAIFRLVVLPQIVPAVLAGSLLVFLYAVSDFGLPQLLRYDTLTRVIFGNLLDRPVSTALALQLGMLALLTTALERGAARRMSGAGAVAVHQGRGGLQWPLGRWRLPVLLATAGLAVAALVGPMTVLVYWAVRGIANGTTRAGSVIADPGQLIAPMLGSASAGILAAAFATLVVLPVAFLTARQRGRSAEAANALVVTGFAIPGLIIALSLSFFVLRSSALVASVLYQTLPLLIVAYVIHFGAQSLRAAQVAVAAVPDDVLEVSRTLGARRLRRLWRIELPLMAPSLLAGAGLVLLSVLKELPATLLLSPPGFRTLATDVWSATSDAFWAEASVVSLVLVALSGLLTWFLVLRHTDALS
ncbi:iron ABC transporter permease [soil metagenome]